MNSSAAILGRVFAVVLQTSKNILCIMSHCKYSLSFSVATLSSCDALGIVLKMRCELQTWMLLRGCSVIQPVFSVEPS